MVLTATPLQGIELFVQRNTTLKFEVRYDGANARMFLMQARARITKW